MNSNSLDFNTRHVSFIQQHWLWVVRILKIHWTMGGADSVNRGTSPCKHTPEIRQPNSRAT